MISAQDLLRKLAEQKARLLEDTFATPPSDYIGFSKALGNFNTLTSVEALVRELARNKDDER